VTAVTPVTAVSRKSLREDFIIGTLPKAPSPPSPPSPTIRKLLKKQKGVSRVGDATRSWGPESLEHVGAIVRRLAAEDPEQWAWLLAGLAEQKEVP